MGCVVIVIICLTATTDLLWADGSQLSSPRSSDILICTGKDINLHWTLNNTIKSQVEVLYFQRVHDRAENRVFSVNKGREISFDDNVKRFGYSGITIQQIRVNQSGTYQLWVFLNGTKPFLSEFQRDVMVLNEDHAPKTPLFIIEMEACVLDPVNISLPTSIVRDGVNSVRIYKDKKRGAITYMRCTGNATYTLDSRIVVHGYSGMSISNVSLNDNGTYIAQIGYKYKCSIEVHINLKVKSAKECGHFILGLATSGEELCCSTVVVTIIASVILSTIFLALVVVFKRKIRDILPERWHSKAGKPPSQQFEILETKLDDTGDSDSVNNDDIN